MKTEEEKLTIRNVIRKIEDEIYEDVLPRGNSNFLLRYEECEDILKDFLKQIRDDLIYHDVDEVFNKYLDKKI